MTSTPKLRALRQERGWTQQEVAEQISRLVWLRERRETGVNADMISKWERGVKKPTRHYRELLGLLFETDAHPNQPDRRPSLLGADRPAPVLQMIAQPER